MPKSTPSSTRRHDDTPEDVRDILRDVAALTERIAQHFKTCPDSSVKEWQEIAAMAARVNERVR
jgi:hypothetical protein